MGIGEPLYLLTAGPVTKNISVRETGYLCKVKTLQAKMIRDSEKK